VSAAYEDTNTRAPLLSKAEVAKVATGLCSPSVSDVKDSLSRLIASAPDGDGLGQVGGIQQAGTIAGFYCSDWTTARANLVRAVTQLGGGGTSLIPQ
jgi:hypothetical protein